MYLSFFSVSRFISLAQKVSNKTFKSIVDPNPDIGRVESFVYGLRPVMKTLLIRYIRKIRHYPLKQGIMFTPTWKSVLMVFRPII